MEKKLASQKPRDQEAQLKVFAYTIWQIGLTVLDSGQSADYSQKSIPPPFSGERGVQQGKIR